MRCGLLGGGGLRLARCVCGVGLVRGVVSGGVAVGLGIGVVVVTQEPVEQVFVEARRVERGAASAVGQGHPRGRPDVVAGDAEATVPGGVGGGGASGDDVGAHAIHVESGADPRDGGQRPW